MTRAKSPVKVTVDLEGVVREAFERLPTGKTRLELSIGPEVREVTADAGQLKQVMVNLLLNAVQAMDGAGTVRVDARRAEDEVSIAVTDDGPGVRPDDRERIFEPLYTTRAKGTGLGLPVCRQIVEAHGGSVGVLDGPSGGARFEIRLPIHPDPDGEAS
jgi:signal transduction histidine kinase